MKCQILWIKQLAGKSSRAHICEIVHVTHCYQLKKNKMWKQKPFRNQLTALCYISNTLPPAWMQRTSSAVATKALFHTIWCHRIAHTYTRPNGCERQHNQLPVKRSRILTHALLSPLRYIAHLRLHGAVELANLRHNGRHVSMCIYSFILTYEHEIWKCIIYISIYSCKRCMSFWLLA